MKKIDFDALRRQIDIVQVINAEGVTLTKKGKNYVGICPFHDDTNPSLSVSPDKQIFKCFVCGTSGNVFTFIRDYEHISFMAAVKKACDLAGIKVAGLEEDTSLPVSPHQKLYDALGEVKKFYANALKGASGQVALDYLYKRKLDDAIITKFSIGFCNNSGVDSIKYLQSKGIDLDDVIYSGIGFSRETEVLDRMNGRITFAITDEYGRVVGFSGRRISEQQDPKYLNTPETVLFHKGNLLYNYFNCEKVCHRLGVVYLVEGFMDVIALARAGLDNAVATMGTALTIDHLKLLQRLNCEVRIMFDSDKAGQSASFKAIEVLKNLPKGIKVVNKFQGVTSKDIDEVLDNYGKDKLLELINSTSNIIDYQISYLYSNINPENYEDRKTFVLQATELIGSLKDDLDIEHYAVEISKLSGFSVDLVKKQVPRNYHQPDTVDISEFKGQFASKNQKKMLDRYDQAERQIVYFLLNDEMAPALFVKEAPLIHNEVYRRLASYIVDYYSEHGQFENDGIIADLLSVLPPDLAKEIVVLDEEKYPPLTLDSLFKIIKEDLPKKLELEQDKVELGEIQDPLEQAKYAKEHLLKEGVMYKKRKNAKKQ
ncbi:MAG: DNA primase [Bacilli bacterium]|nr:DNA primase [Bacilli bacterium]